MQSTFLMFLVLGVMLVNVEGTKGKSKFNFSSVIASQW